MVRERQRPRRLRRGDTVAIVAPAGPVPEDLLDIGIGILESWGLRVHEGKHLRDRHSQLKYLAGSDADRASDLQQAWCDPAIRGVFCARGGYGSMRILDHLDWQAMANAEPKVFAGSSDITAIHDALVARLDVVTVLSAMVATQAFATQEATREHLRRTVFEPETVTIVTRSTAGALVPGRARGVTYGGNLSVLAGTLGTDQQGFRPSRGIALLEDVTEKPYQLDRFVTQLLRSGFFSNATGIALGSWTDCGPGEEVEAVMRDRLGQLGVPIIWELGFGHCANQRTIPLGMAAEIDTDARRLTLLQPTLI